MCCEGCPSYKRYEEENLVDFHALTGMALTVNLLKDGCLKGGCCPKCPGYYDCVGSIDKEENL